MQRSIALIVAVLLLSLARPSVAASDPKAVKELYERVSPSLVVVQYTFDSELGRQELSTGGIVISADGLVIISSAVTPNAMPDEQMKDFKIIIPGDDETEIEAEFQGRDD